MQDREEFGRKILFTLDLWNNRVVVKKELSLYHNNDPDLYKKRITMVKNYMDSNQNLDILDDSNINGEFHNPIRELKLLEMFKKYSACVPNTLIKSIDMYLTEDQQKLITIMDYFGGANYKYCDYLKFFNKKLAQNLNFF